MVFLHDIKFPHGLKFFILFAFFLRVKNIGKVADNILECHDQPNSISAISQMVINEKKLLFDTQTGIYGHETFLTCKLLLKLKMKCYEF